MSPAAGAPAFFDRYTAHHHLRAVASLGVLSGIFLLNAEFAIGTLGATPWQILALLLLPALAQTLVVFRNPVDPRRGWIRRPFRRLVIPVHLLLFLPLLGLLPAAAWPFILLVAGCSAVQMLTVPLQNGILAVNYAPATRGRRFGTANAVHALALVAVALPAGWLLDRYPGSWRWLYALAGVAGVYGYLQWSRLRRRRVVQAAPPAEEHASPWEALRHDRPFLAFEACFMAYGLGFLMLMPVLPVYLIEELEVSYVEVSYAKGALFWIVMVIAGPFLGRLSDRIGILRLNVLAFLTLALFPMALIALDGMVGMYVGYAIFGLAMSGVFLGWTLGPIQLAGNRDPAPYLDAHLGLVGIRSVVGMTAGVWIQQQLGTHAVLYTVIALEIAAALGMGLVARRVRSGTEGGDRDREATGDPSRSKRPPR